MDGKKILMLNVDPQGDLTKMLGRRKPQDLPPTLANAMNDVVAGRCPTATRRLCTTMRVLISFQGIAACPPWKVSLVNVMSRETVVRQYVDGVKRDYDYVLLDCRPSLGMLVINVLLVRVFIEALPKTRMKSRFLATGKHISLTTRVLQNKA